MKPIKIVAPEDVKHFKPELIEESKVFEDLVSGLIEEFNLTVMGGHFDTNPNTGEMLFEIHKRYIQSPVLNKAVELINENGWIARHEQCYSPTRACPSYGIFFKIKK